MEKLDLSLNGMNASEAFESAGTTSVLDTGLYQAMLKAVYLDTTKGGTPVANAVVEINGLTKTFPMYIAYKDTKKPVKVVNGQRQVIPGYKQLNSLAYCATGLTIDALTQEEKVIKVYDWNTRKEEPQTVLAFSELMGKQIAVGIKKVEKHKTAKVNGQYLPTTETYFTNEIDRYYTPDGLLAQEKATGSEAKYAVKWKEKTGQIFQEKLAVTPIAPPTGTASDMAAATAGTQVKSLFDD